MQRSKYGLLNKGYTNKLDEKGSLTVEACLILPAFLCFFFFLFYIIKFCCLTIILDHAVKESVKEIAAGLYPYEVLAESDEEERDDRLPSLLSGHYKVLLETGKYELADKILEKYVENTLVNQENIKLRIVELPQFGYSPGRDKEDDKQVEEQADDVVLCIDYEVKVPFPFLRDRTVLLSHYAVEKAWLHGSYGTYAAEEEQSITKINKEERYVYVTRTGNKYHRQDCRYLHSSRIKLPLSKAIQDYEPCLVCNPPQE